MMVDCGVMSHHNMNSVPNIAHIRYLALSYTLTFTLLCVCMCVNYACAVRTTNFHAQKFYDSYIILNGEFDLTSEARLISKTSRSAISTYCAP